MSGGKGGSNTQSQKIPEWLEGPAKENLARAKDVQQLDFMPWMGPSAAALTPMQLASMQNTGQAAGAFGMAGSNLTGTEGMPTPQQFAGGITGYSDFPIYEQARNLYAQYDPTTYAARNALFIGGPGGSAASPGPAAPAASPSTLTDQERRMGLTEEMKSRGMTVRDMWGR